MSDTRTVAVVGATGAQGGSLARAILEDRDSGFSVRAITRQVGCAPAQALAQRGAQVVYADADDLETLERAFAGANAVFCVTNFWEHFSPERELAQAANMAAAARCAGVAHVIWSTLENTRQWLPLHDDRMPTLMGKYKVPHFDAKGEADGEFERLGLPTTFMRTSFYWDNFIAFPGTGPVRGPDGRLVLRLPIGHSHMPGIAAEDIGRCALGILKRRAEYVGRTVGIAGEHLTGAELASGLGRALGEEVRYESVAPEVYRTFDIPGAADLANMFQFKRDFEDAFRGARNVEESRRLNPSLQTFAQWLASHASRILIST
jgi:uncharacterized protein YbjT (DUF2867 family)